MACSEYFVIDNLAFSFLRISSQLLQLQQQITLSLERDHLILLRRSFVTKSCICFSNSIAVSIKKVIKVSLIY